MQLKSNFWGNFLAGEVSANGAINRNLQMSGGGGGREVVDAWN